MIVPSPLIAALQVVLVLVGAPLLTGFVRSIRARIEGRKGPPITQPLRDLRKLFHKATALPEHSSWVYRLAPLVLMSSALLVAAIAPFVSTHSPFDPVGDLFTVVYLLLLGAAALALGGLDPGTAFGGMGASREMTIAALAEPAILLAIFSLSIPAESSNLSQIVETSLDDPSRLATPTGLLALAAFGIVLLAETGRLPVDNPSTHLELTMIHEAMVLEYAGPDLALVELASSMRLLIFSGLLACLFFPWGVDRSGTLGSVAFGIVAFGAKLSVIAAVLAVFEAHTAKLRLFRVPELLALAFVLAFMAVVSSAVLG